MPGAAGARPRPRVAGNGSTPPPPGAAVDPAAAEAELMAALLAVDPVGLGGIVLRGGPGAARETWLDRLRRLGRRGTPCRTLPAHIADERLLGGVDLARTLAAGRKQLTRGLLAEADGGVLVLAMAERVTAATAARIAAAQDRGLVLAERDGSSWSSPARFALIALDEGEAEDEAPPAALLDRLAFRLALAPLEQHGPAATARALRERKPAGPGRAAIGRAAAARRALATVETGHEAIEALCAAATSLGVASPRAAILALRAARASAAWHGRSAVAEEDLAVAGRLVLAPRATMLPPGGAEAEPGEPAPDPAPPEPDGDADRDDEDPGAASADLEALVLAAAKAAIPSGLLDRLKHGAIKRPSGAGRAGPLQQAGGRGRPAGVRPGRPRPGAPLALVDTLRAAAPWQALRRRERFGSAALPADAPRLLVRADDLRVARIKRRARTLTVVLVDASGSAALHRLAEAKGAVELLLADCYIRRDSVALLAFRGVGAELLLPPTRSLARAKRELAALPGGGATPIAAAIDAATQLCQAARRRGEAPSLVLLSDGRANVARDGRHDRDAARADALAAARAFALTGLPALLVDTAPLVGWGARGEAAPAAELARAMHGHYLRLPRADAQALSEAMRRPATA